MGCGASKQNSEPTQERGAKDDTPTETPLEQCVAKMRAAKVSGACITQFTAQHQYVASGETGAIPEASILPAEGLLSYAQLGNNANADFLKETVVLKLNGGLGTGMGLSKAKSLLTVKGEDTFLDFIAKQCGHFQEEYKQPLKFMLMNSFSTSADTKAFFQKKYPALAQDFDSMEVIQNKTPKLLQNGLSPALYEQQPECEWVPPGHGDLYAALLGTGKLDKLLAGGYKYMFVSNSDNLGATLDLKLLAEFAGEKWDFMMEVAERTEADKKGGHLAKDPKDGKWLLRESAQCPKEDEASFQDIQKHKYFNTNNLWINLVSLKKTMDELGGMLPLPVIRNDKKVCPTDASSAKVWQLETAMGTAISSFANATAIVVPRTRFAPVKTCNDLLAVRSDCYVVTPDHRLVLADSRNGKPPVVSLEDKHYKFVAQIEKLIPDGAPSMIACDRLTIKGAVQFAAGTSLSATVSVVKPEDCKEERPILSGTLTGDVTHPYFM